MYRPIDILEFMQRWQQFILRLSDPPSIQWVAQAHFPRLIMRAFQHIFPHEKLEV
jgi:hypothetical protein